MESFKSIGAVAAQLPIFQRYSKVARVIANRLARRIVERQLLDRGVRVTCFPYAQLRELTQEYLAANPKLLDQATEIVWSDPKLRKMAEVEQRQRERQWRKWQRKSGSNPSVT